MIELVTLTGQHQYSPIKNHPNPFYESNTSIRQFPKVSYLLIKHMFSVGVPTGLLRIH